MPQMLSSGGVRRSSASLFRAFSWVAGRRLRSGFRAVRLLRGNPVAQHRRDERLIVCLNHPSWWDPLMCIALARILLPAREHYAPISAAALHRYEFFSRIGMFPVEGETPRGAAQFLRAAQAILDARGVLWITAQGRFTDARSRPVDLKTGLGALLHRLPSATVLPLALEYTFWDQRLPEALAAFGSPLSVVNGGSRTAGEWTDVLAAGLQETQDALAAASLQRSPALFDTLMEGGRGTAGVYGGWQRLRARLRGEMYNGDHAIPPQQGAN
jgi:1-acyl-sn-glycerol-3-phosphate acyltransferase